MAGSGQFKSGPDEPKATRGLVLELQRMSTEDGPGLRTTVFLKGCSLACRWCHNPESISSAAEVQWIGSRCIGCQSCITSCLKGALSSGATGIAINRTSCDGCGACVEVCPTTALERLGCWWSVDRMVAELVKDRAYFERSGGGVTFSGGEPALQSGFVRELSCALRGAGVHVAVDTCGQCGPKTLEAILANCDLVLFDLKVLDSARHQELTGHDNRLILQNLDLLAAHPRVQRGEVAVWIRTPLIPGDTDSPENIGAIAELLASKYQSMVARYELCAFNNLGRDKYKRLGRSWPYEQEGAQHASVLDHLVQVAVAAGLPASVVRWSGSGPLSRASQPHKAGKTACQEVS